MLLAKHTRSSGNPTIKIDLNKDRVNGLESNSVEWVHSDIRSISIFDNNGIDEFYLGHDGGISTSEYQCNNNSGYCWSLINGDGFTITQYHGIGIHENNPEVFYGGAQDGNGAVTLDGVNWTAGLGLDAGDVILYDDNTNKRALMDYGRPSFYNSNGSSRTSVPNPTGYFGSRFEVLPSHRDIIFYGIANLYSYNFNNGTPVKELMRVTGLSRGDRVTDFSICESQPNSKITATDKITKGTSNYGGSLLRTSINNPHYQYDWIDITPHIPNLHWGVIDAVEQDPMNPDKIWIGCSGFSNSPGTERIYYTSTGGSNNTYPGGWSDYSAGLPNLPIQEIRYQLGSNDLLYAATDVGVFYRTATMSQWECYNYGMPPGVVNDIDLSYCTGKIAASVYGRGAYKNNLLNIPWDITTNTTWNEKRWLSVDLHIKSGAILTIKDSLLIYPNAKIINR